MGVDKYTGKKGTGYGVDYSFKVKRIRERVGSNKKEAAEYLGKKLKEIRDGKSREGPDMDIMGHSDHRMMRRCAHLTPEHKRKAVNSLPEWIVWQKSVTNLEGAVKADSSIEAQSIGSAGA